MLFVYIQLSSLVFHLKMLCYCRYMRRVLSSNTRPSLYLQTFLAKNVHAQFLSTENETFQQEKSTSSPVVRETRMLEFYWRKQKNGNRFKSTIYEYIFKNGGTSSCLVDLLQQACDKSNCPPELVYSLLENINNAISENGLDFSPKFQNKKEALQCVLKYKSYPIIQLTFKLFKMGEQSHCFKEFIDNLIKEQKLIEAAYCIIALNLQQEYNIEEIVFPLLLEGKLHPVKSCIENHPELQLNLAKKLDSLLVNGEINSSSNAPAINSKTIFRTLSKLVNCFKIPTEQCKYLHYVRSRAAINILTKRRTEQSVTQEVWEEMVTSVIGENKHLKEHLIYRLMKNNDKETALKMMGKLNMHDFDIASLKLPTEEETNFENIDDKEDLEEIPNEELKIENGCGHLTFPLSTSDVKFIDSEKQFTDFISDIVNYDMVGIDSEWKPNFGLSADRLALMQVAVHDKVYILDMLSLRDCLTAKHWDEFIENLFGNPKIVKLGCGIMSDVQMIVESNQGTKGKKIRFSHLLDMAVFYEKLQEVYPDEMVEAPVKENQTKGLSKLCEIILGQPLNKEERLCDWEKRPLTESQLQYAALDAFCLIQMFDELKQNAIEKNMNFDHLVKVAMFQTTSLWKPKRRLKGVKNEKDIQIKKPIPIQEFKVVMDSRLEPQAKQLRQMGADVLVLNNLESPETALQISKSEERILICSEHLWRQVQHLNSEAYCFRPINKYGDHVPIASILHRFNVQFNAKRIMSRCMVCNNEESVKLSPEDLSLLQECVRNQDFSVLDSDKENNSFGRTLSELIKSGISVTFKKESGSYFTEKTQAFLCTKCGTVQ